MAIDSLDRRSTLRVVRRALDGNVQGGSNRVAIQQVTERVSTSLDTSAITGAALPVLEGQGVTLRELRLGDAATLLEHVSPPEVLRHIAPAPTTVEGFEGFIRWTRAQRRRRLHAAFGVIPSGAVRPVGIFQFWPVELDWSTAEWGFVMGQQYWGTGLFERSARLMLDFAFDRAGVKRMEARSADVNGRGNGALAKIGAISEGTLRGAFRRGTCVNNHVMWSILAHEWRADEAAFPAAERDA